MKLTHSNNWKKISKLSVFAVIMALLMVTVSMAGCIGGGADENVKTTGTDAGNKQVGADASSDLIEIVDTQGRTVKIPKTVNRVVCSGAGALRQISYLKATDLVVGVETIDHDSAFGRPYTIANYETFKELPITGLGGGKDVGNGPYPEATLVVKPDVVFVVNIDATKADSIQEKLGIPVVVLAYDEITNFNDEKLFNSLTIAGKILDRNERAEELINIFKDYQADLTKRTAGVTEKPTVYVGGICNRGSHGVDSTKGIFPPFEAIGLHNIVTKPGHSFINPETLVAENPDYIFIDEGSFENIEKDYNENPEYYASLGAFQNGKVYCTLPYTYYSTNYGTAIVDAYYIGKVVYPEQFADINPEEKADEIYTAIVGKPVYNEMAKTYGGFAKFDELVNKN
ncbi:ABC transporter substrate-binding protein [Methanococcus voltae]|uniref:Iron complex transport system substrate-binding protein n=2 Tax=Methanococcus voltae TaxID=2188 RepID=A0A8J7UUF3_METVO|nr:ABC transporter substrate-binding protein [Methanococcus voltae]MBP2171791.1 iron complex transport system substrate-binding protein [Methanococcus voltae]MBP2201271.1 iron complex transport system substrate-binding protein [Methanococcus voltae]MCS3922787.1 iron complex transport system substrate-binding protein [Methanococcus voltae PS]